MFQITLSSRMCGICGWLVYFLLIFTLTKGSVVPQDKKDPAKDFSRHRLVQPTLHHGRTKREISSTRDINGAHHSEVTMTVDVEGQDYVLDLQLNEDLVARNHTLSYQKGGKTVLHKPKKEDLDLCHYSGSVRGMPGSWVALSTCHGVRGVVYDGKKMRYIEPADGGEIQSNHFLYDHNDLNTNYRYGNEDGVTYNTKYEHELMARYQALQDLERSRVSRHKRSTRDPRYVELVLVADHKEYLANGENVEAVQAYMLQVANIINSMYDSQLNIFIALVGVVVWSERDEMKFTGDGNQMLADFANYRRLVLDIPNDNAQLLTHHRFTNPGTIGKGYIGGMCSSDKSVGVAVKHSEVIGLVTATIAHEMGHNLGMLHDNICCFDGNCVMEPYLGDIVPTQWSSCSLWTVGVFFAQGKYYCLRNKPERIANSMTCGNGILEYGEQCDCGHSTSAAECRACCDHDTCMLRSHASCANGRCCNIPTCRFKAWGTKCKSKYQKCNLPRFCSGRSEFCHSNVLDDLFCWK